MRPSSALMVASVGLSASSSAIIDGFQPEISRTHQRTAFSSASSKIYHEQRLSLFSSSSSEHIEENENESNASSESSLARRDFLLGTLGAFSALTLSPPSHARGLVKFPVTYPLLNTYHVMRAGMTLLEETDIFTTNPLFLTNREAALSGAGLDQVRAAAAVMAENGIAPSVVKYSLAASAIDSADVVKEELLIGQNRMVPEFTFMDPRGIGKYDMMSIAEVKPAIVALDATEAGPEGRGGRPPANDDGTPNETLQDQSIRLRQLMSVLETQYSGDDILLIFPDGTSPALLSCMIAGIPYNRVHELEFAPGEIHLDVKMDNTMALLSEKEKDPTEYEATLSKGRDELKRLQSMDVDALVSKKDQQIEKERQEIERDYAKAQVNKKKQEEKELREREKRQQELRDREEKRQQAMRENRQRISEADDKESSPLAVAGLAGAVVAGLSLSGSSSTDLSLEEQDKVGVNATATSSSASIPFKSSDDIGSKSSLEDDSSTEDIPQNEEVSTIFESILSEEKVEPEKEEETDPIVAAEVTMQEYLDQDDGGEAWLKVMGQLIEGDEENEIMFEEEFGDGMINGSQDRLDENFVVVNEGSSSGTNETNIDPWSSEGGESVSQ